MRLRERLRPRTRPADDPRTQAWPEALAASSPGPVRCCICGWTGAAYLGWAHSERALCPVCGSIARDRFLFWCWLTRVPYDAAAVVVETSPRLDQRYRGRLAALVDYRASDYDLRAHRGSLQLDLQDIALPDASVDVVLTPHVLEHVPDTGRALAELRRVLRPGGQVLLQVPLPRGRTAPPPGPEWHGDSTPVFWQFGWDLADAVQAAGLDCTVLVTQELRAAAGGPNPYVHELWDCDVDDLMERADPAALTVVADDREALAGGFRPGYQFVTLACARPP